MLQQLQLIQTDCCRSRHWQTRRWRTCRSRRAKGSFEIGFLADHKLHLHPGLLFDERLRLFYGTLEQLQMPPPEKRRKDYIIGQWKVNGPDMKYFLLDKWWKIAHLLRAYCFSVWTLILRAFYGIERYQVHMIATSPFMEKLCEFFGMLYCIIDSSCSKDKSRSAKQFVTFLKPKSSMRNRMGEENWKWEVNKSSKLKWIHYLKVHTQKILFDLFVGNNHGNPS